MLTSFPVIESRDLPHKTLSERNDPHTFTSILLKRLWASHERVYLLHLGPERLYPHKQHHGNHRERLRLVLCSNFSITQQNIWVTLTQWASFWYMMAQSHSCHKLLKHFRDISDSSSQQTWLLPDVDLNVQKLSVKCKHNTLNVFEQNLERIAVVWRQRN